MEYSEDTVFMKIQSPEKSLTLECTFSAMSFIYNMNNIGMRIVPLETPDDTSMDDDEQPSTITHLCLTCYEASHPGQVVSSNSIILKFQEKAVVINFIKGFSKV